MDVTDRAEALQQVGAEADAPLSLRGTVDASEARSFWQAARARVAAGGDVAIDCAGALHVSTAVLQLLLALDRELALHGGRLRLREVPPSVARTISMAGLGDLLGR